MKIKVLITKQMIKPSHTSWDADTGTGEVTGNENNINTGYICPPKSTAKMGI